MTKLKRVISAEGLKYHSTSKRVQIIIVVGAVSTREPTIHSKLPEAILRREN